MTSPTLKKTITTHPRSKREMKVDVAIYEPFKEAILQCLKGSKGKTFAELVDDVGKIIKKKIPGSKNQSPGIQFLFGSIWRQKE